MLIVFPFLQVSAQPLDDTTTELPGLTTTDKPIPFEDVMKDSSVKIMIDLLMNCDYQDPGMKFHRKAMEDGLKDVMNRKKFSQHTEKVMFAVFMSRNVSFYSYSSLIVYSCNSLNIR